MTEPTQALDSVREWRRKNRADRTFRWSVGTLIVLLLLAVIIMGMMLAGNGKAINRLSDLADEKGEIADNLCKEKSDEDPDCKRAAALPDSKEIVEDSKPQVVDLPDPFDDPDPNDPDPFDDPDPNNPEIQDDESQEPEAQESESQEPEIQDGDPNDPDPVDDPDPNDPDPVDDPDPDDPDPNDPPNCEGEFVCNEELNSILADYATQSWVLTLFTGLGCSIEGIGSELLTCTITGKSE